MYSFGFEIDGKKYVKYQIFLLRIGDVKLLEHVLLFSVRSVSASNSIQKLVGDLSFYPV